MQVLDIKLFRDFRRLWVQVLAIAMVLACGVAIVLTSFGMYRALGDTRQAYYERNRFADVFVAAKRAPQSLLPDLRRVAGVQAVEARITGYSILDVPGHAEIVVGHILSLPETGEHVLNVPVLRRGAAPQPGARYDVMVNDAFALAHGLAPGDSFDANLNGTLRRLTITGTVLSPEFIYSIGPGQLMPDNAAYGIVWLPERTAEAAFDMTGAFNHLSVKLVPGARAEAVIDAVDDLLDDYGGLGAYGRDLHPSDSYVSAELNQLRGMALVLPPIFFGISAFLVSMVMGRIVTLERSEIGLLKAIGYSDTEVMLHYQLLAGLVALVGIAVGWIFGAWLAHGLAVQYAQFFDFPFLIYSVSPGAYAGAGLLALSTTALGAARSAWRAARLAPAVAMQPPAPPQFRRSLLDRMLEHVRVRQSTTMILRSLARWPLRSALTILGLSLAVSAVVAAFFINDALDEIIDRAFFQSNRQDAVLLFSDDLPDTALADVARLPGVLAAEGQQAHPAILRHGARWKRVAIEARAPGADLARIVGRDGRAVDAPPGGIVLSQRLAQHLNAGPGTAIEAEFLTGRRETHTITVTDTVEQYFGLGAYVDLGYLNTLFRQRPQIGSANVLVDPAALGALHARVRELPVLMGLAMLTDTRQSFQDTIRQNIVIMNTVYITIAVLITVGVAYNGARIQLSERARELASLRILGFTRTEVSYILVGETMLLALLAQPLGWLIGTWIATAMTNAFSSDLYTIPLVLRPHTFSLASLVVLGAAAVSVLIVRRRLDRLDLVTVMKTRE